MAIEKIGCAQIRNTVQPNGKPASKKWVTHYNGLLNLGKPL